MALHPDHQRIARGAAWVALFVLVGKLAGAAKEMAVAYRYGVSGVVDAYQLALTVVTWLPGTLVSVIAITLIPILVRLRQRDATEYGLFLQEIQGTTLILGGLFMLVSVGLGPLALAHLAAHLPEPTQLMARQLIFGLAVVALLTLLIGVYAARLQARERQVNTLLESAPAAAILGCVLLWPVGADIAPLLWGTVLGFVVQAVWLAVLARRADGQAIRSRWRWRSPHWREFYQTIGVMMVGQFLMSFITPLDQYFASQLGDGAIATLGYANRVLALILSLGAISVGRATLPIFSEMVAAREGKKALWYAKQWAGIFFMVGSLVAILAWWLAPWGVEILFQHGAFKQQDTQAVVNVLRFGLFQLPFYLSCILFIQIFASFSLYNVLLISGVLAIITKSFGNYYFCSYFGVPGITLSSSLVYLVNCLFFYFLVYINGSGSFGPLKSRI